MKINLTDSGLWPSELGVTQASRLAGIPEVTLRLHVDQGKVLGVRRTESGRRMISRQGLLAYLQARGLDQGGRRTGATEETQSQVRIRWGHFEGTGRLERTRGRAFEVSGLDWKGPLPDPDAPVAFRIEGGELDGAVGEASPVWILWRGGRLDLGLKHAQDLAGRVGEGA